MWAFCLAMVLTHGVLPEERPSVFVWSLEASRPQDDELAQVLSGRVVDALRRSDPLMRVVHDREMQDLLARAGLTALGQCTSCLEALEADLHVRRVVTGRVTRLGGMLVVSLALVDLSSAEVVASVQELVDPSDPRALLKSVDGVVLHLLQDELLRGMARGMDEVVSPPEPAPSR